MVKSYKTVVFIQLFRIYTIVRIWENIYFIQISYSQSFTISRWSISVDLASVVTRMLAVTCFKWNTRGQVHGQNERNRVRSRVAEPRSTDPVTPTVRRHAQPKEPVRRTGSSPGSAGISLACSG